MHGTHHSLAICIILMAMMAEGGSSNQRQQYTILFDGNNSKRWDGKEMWLDVEVLDELYESNELYHGTNVTVPWKGKEGKSAIGNVCLSIRQ